MYHWQLEHNCCTQFTHAVLDVPNKPVEEDPHLSDLNPLDFYLLWHLTTPVDNKEALCSYLMDTCQTIHNNNGIFEQVQWSMMRHVEVSIDSRDAHFEHL
jgi:hypothetical protein